MHSYDHVLACAVQHYLLLQIVQLLSDWIAMHPMRAATNYCMHFHLPTAAAC